MKSILFRSEARLDALEAHQWYETQRPGLGNDFKSELTRAFTNIGENPSAWSIVHRQTRRYLLHRFPYAVFYRVYDSTIVSVGIIYTSRNPSLWKRRK